MAEQLANATRHLRTMRPAVHGRMARVLAASCESAPFVVTDAETGEEVRRGVRRRGWEELAAFHVDRSKCDGCRGERAPLGFASVRTAAQVRDEALAVQLAIGTDPAQ